MSIQNKKHKRWTAKRKFEAVLELISGRVSLDELSRNTGQPAHILSGWRDEFLKNGEALFKSPTNPNEMAQRAEIARLREKLGETIMDNEVLHMAVEQFTKKENRRPFATRKSKT